ncbi:hypothetical protein RFI_18832 [Reticulomyxa filosa]|uniref:GP-PDE domain-containing protein n=1 Tax=Reticulomyxa filosa TaxID=46433 RepID=X6MXU1_RETFI|nr:hypothetical protein RFI_18832 [Reticulomyxa filosa]|eukprot:ETO18431.1 hypothetical protein RFI_18832 [Reticulomyxa filosa]
MLGTCIQKKKKNKDAPGLEKSAKPDDEKVDMLQNGMEGLDWLQDDYCTLEEAFHQVPSSVGFNIEIKYPNYDECVEDDLSVVDINEYLDKILQVIFDCVGNRKIMFSSFHPDICVLLMAKQPQYPYSDPRTSSLNNAVQFARKNDLFGIVSSAVPFVAAPHLINFIHKSELLVLTYGDSNNDIQSVDAQRRHGIDGLIADHVQYVYSHIKTNPIKGIPQT